MWLAKLQDMPSLVTAVTASSVCVGLVFLLGYTWPISTKLIFMLSYRDILIVTGHSFLSLIIAAAVGQALYEIDAGSKKVAELKTLDTRPKLSTRNRAFFDLISSRRFPTKVVAVAYIFIEALGFIFLPKSMMQIFSCAGFIVGVTICILIFAKEWTFGKGRYLFGVAVIAINVFLYGNGEFYKEAFYSTSEISLSEAVDDSRNYTLVRPINEGLLLLNKGSGNVYVVQSDFKRWLHFRYPVCNENEFHMFVRFASERRVSCD